MLHAGLLQGGLDTTIQLIDRLRLASDSRINYVDPGNEGIEKGGIPFDTFGNVNRPLLISFAQVGHIMESRN